MAEDHKLKAVSETCHREGIPFIPLADESLVGWYQVAVGEVKKLAAPLARQQGDKEKEAARRLPETDHATTERELSTLAKRHP